jgi:hypothetical protein
VKFTPPPVPPPGTSGSPAASAASRTSSRLSVALGVAGFLVTAVVGGGVFAFLSGDGKKSGATSEPSLKPDVPVAITSGEIQSALDAEVLNRELSAAMSGQHWETAAQTWVKLLAADSSFAGKRKTEVLPKIQEKLIPALLARFESQFAKLYQGPKKGAADFFKPEQVRKNRDEFAEAIQLVERVEANAAPEVKKQLTEFRERFALLEALPWATPPVGIHHWEDVKGTVGLSKIYLQNPDLCNFLNTKHGGTLSLRYFPVNEWRDASATETDAPKGAVLPADFQERKVLFLRFGSGNTPRVHFYPERQHVRLEQTSVSGPDATPLESLLAARKSLCVTFTAAAEEASAAFLLLSPDSTPPPVKASRSLLMQAGAFGGARRQPPQPAGVGIPEWMEKALPGLEASGVKYVLYPERERDVATRYADIRSWQKHPAARVSPESVNHARKSALSELRKGLQKSQKKLESDRKALATAGTSTRERIEAALAAETQNIERLHKEIAALDGRGRFEVREGTSFLSQPDAWVLAFADAHGHLIPLIRFE